MSYAVRDLRGQGLTAPPGTGRAPWDWPRPLGLAAPPGTGRAPWDWPRELQDEASTQSEAKVSLLNLA